MKIIKKVIIALLVVLPEKSFVFLRKKLNKKCKYRLDYIWFLRFKKNFSKINENEFTKKMIISKGAFEYKKVNVCFINNMVALGCYALANEMIPVFDVSFDNDNLWNLYFEQPFRETREQCKSILCNQNDFYYFTPHWGCVYKIDELLFWNAVFKKMVCFNDKMESYCKADLKETLPKGKKILGVLYRGTDYTTLKPKGHPVQPELDELFEKVDDFVNKYDVDYIYLATEEKRIFKLFSNRYRGKVIQNTREYIDDVYYNNNCSYIGEVDKMIDVKDSMKTYLSSMNILSKCDYLVAGNCGGTLLASIWNGGNYIKAFIFDKGVYE